jgi:hypothetical protein
MTTEDLLLCACVRQDFLDRHREIVESLARGAVRWELLAATAERHGVAPIAGYNLRRSAARVPAAVAAELEGALFENALFKAQEDARLAEGISRLRDAGYQVMLLKGLALDRLVYREPWVTTSRDADLLLRPEPGRRLADDEREVRRSLYRSGVECDLLEHHDVNMNGVLPVSFERIWSAARAIPFLDSGGPEVFVMAPEDLLISICINNCRKRFLRLKGLFDLAESARRLEGLDWGKVAARAREDRCEGIVYTALLAARATVGCELPDGALEALAVGPVRARLLRSLVAGFLRTGSLAAIDGTGAAPSSGLSLLLPYASYRWEQALRSFRFALSYRPPEHHRPPAALAG